MINWHNRYAKLLQRNPGLFDPSRSVLEVGSGLQGIALWLQRPIVGPEPVWSGVPNRFIEPVQGDIRDLPFAADSFDYVVCADVFEHLPPSARDVAVRELIRVSREKVLITCPCGRVALDGEVAFADLMHSLDLPVPDWLQEHFECGLPEIGQLVQILIGCGLPFELIGNENRLQHYAGLVLDTTMPMAADWNIRHAAKTVLEPPVGESPWDEYYSYLFTVDKRQQRRRPPAAPLPDSDPTVDREPTTAIYAVVHDASVMVDIAPLTYICTGAASHAPRPTLSIPPLTDSGYLVNSRWSELSAIYSVWKDGPATDVVGFCHYRRFFNFGPNDGAERQETIDPSAISTVRANFTCPDLMTDVLRGLVVVAKPLDLEMTVFEHYSRCHNANDYLTMFNIVAEMCPELVPVLAEDFSTQTMHCNNMFIMNWEHFDRMCSTWFLVLQEFCARVDAFRAREYQSRDVSFLSERLFNAWIKYARNQGVRVREQSLYFVDYPADPTPSAATALANLGYRPPVLAGERLRTATAALEAETTRADKLLEAVQSEEAERRRLADELATMRASDAWRLSQRLRNNAVARRAYRTARDVQRRLRRS